MAQLEVLFDVPEYIESGLTLGTLERVGGVIRDSNTKRIVAWLRDGGMEQTPDSLRRLLQTSSLLW